MKQFSILLTLVLNTGLDMSPTEDTYFFFTFSIYNLLEYENYDGFLL